MYFFCFVLPDHKNSTSKSGNRACILTESMIWQELFNFYSVKQQIREIETLFWYFMKSLSLTHHYARGLPYLQYKAYTLHLTSFVFVVVVFKYRHKSICIRILFLMISGALCSLCQPNLVIRDLKYLTFWFSGFKITTLQWLTMSLKACEESTICDIYLHNH